MFKVRNFRKVKPTKKSELKKRTLDKFKKCYNRAIKN